MRERERKEYFFKYFENDAKRVLLLNDARIVITDDQQPQGRAKLGDGASRADDHADGEGSIADADLFRRGADRSPFAGSRRAPQPHQAQVLVVGGHGVLLVARKRLPLDRGRKQRPAGAAARGHRAQALPARPTDASKLSHHPSLRGSSASPQLHLLPE